MSTTSRTKPRRCSGTATTAAWASKWDHILVDGMQDATLPEYRLIRALGGGHGRVTAVADPDQAIYSWRGAEDKNIERFKADFRPEIVELQANHRSNRTIAEAARAVLHHGEGAAAARGREVGGPIQVVKHRTGHDEARWIQNLAADVENSSAETGDGRGLAVLYRTNAQARPIEDQLVRSGIRYTVSAGAFYERAEIRDAAAYLKLVEDPSDDEALLRILNKPPRGIGDEAVKTIRNADLPARDRNALFDVRGDAADQAGGRPTLMERLRTACGEDGREPVLKPKQAEGARALLKAIDAARDVRDGSEGSPGAVLETVMTRSGYVNNLMRSPGRDDAERLESLHRLVETARDYERRADGAEGQSPPDGSLRGFLDEMREGAEANHRDPGGARVHLMTLHAAKGKEFDHVVIAGCEEGLCPLEPHDEDRRPVKQQQAEEQRLFHVGMTRARQTLQLSAAGERSTSGERWLRTPSRFIGYIPAALREEVEMPPCGLKHAARAGPAGARKEPGPGTAARDPVESPHQPAGRGRDPRLRRPGARAAQHRRRRSRRPTARRTENHRRETRHSAAG